MAFISTTLVGTLIYETIPRPWRRASVCAESDSYVCPGVAGVGLGMNFAIRGITLGTCKDSVLISSQGGCLANLAWKK